MIALVQRVSEASVSVEGKEKSAIGPGLLILLGVTHDDDDTDRDWLLKKIPALRIFDDDAGVMNKSVQDIGGEVMVVSQFTLHARVKKGSRPSYVDAAKPDKAEPMYQGFVHKLETILGQPVKTGEFGAMMQIRLVNDGPVTLHIDTKNRK